MEIAWAGILIFKTWGFKVLHSEGKHVNLI
jgi:hypothetical protein